VKSNNLDNLHNTMVEANMDPEGYEQEDNKTFLDEPAILDKFKAAAVITDGKLD